MKATLQIGRLLKSRPTSHQPLAMKIGAHQLPTSVRFNTMTSSSAASGYPCCPQRPIPKMLSTCRSTSHLEQKHSNKFAVEASAAVSSNYSMRSFPQFMPTYSKFNKSPTTGLFSKLLLQPQQQQQHNYTTGISDSSSDHSLDDLVYEEIDDKDLKSTFIEALCVHSVDSLKIHEDTDSASVKSIARNRK